MGLSPLNISARFDAGNIDIIDASSAEDVQLAIRPDASSEHYQWFYFRVAGAAGRSLRCRITNAGGASYPKGWGGYRACASYDRERWFRVDTQYRDGQLIIDHNVAADTVWYAYFAPYGYERHQSCIARWQLESGARHDVLGHTLDGRDMDLVTVGEGDVPIWIIARLHPGESMAEWLVEGLLDRLLDPAESLARQLRLRATFHVVPNMNPDGSVRGHLRTNAAGANLNRVWEEPTLERSPEVFHVKRHMKETGVALCLDVHGDEGLPYNFIAGPDGVEGLPEHVLRLRDRYSDALTIACPDFQREHGYPRSALGKANMTMCTNQIAHTFGAVAMTLEQPFKDAANLPDPEVGWSPQRCKSLGRSQLDAITAVIDDLPR